MWLLFGQFLGEIRHLFPIIWSHWRQRFFSKEKSNGNEIAALNGPILHSISGQDLGCTRRRRRSEHQQVLEAGGSPGLVVMGGDSCSKGREFESQHCILDGHFFTIICCKNCNVCLKRQT